MKRDLLPLDRLLSGGDLRSIGRADQAAEELLAGERTSGEFLCLLEEAPAAVRMRAADALEKATRRAPGLLAESGPRLLALLGSAAPKEVRWHLLQMCSRLHWRASQQSLLLSAIEAAATDESAIVQTCALQALAELAPLATSFASAYQRQLRAAGASPHPSLRARARKLAKRKDA